MHFVKTHEIHIQKVLLFHAALSLIECNRFNAIVRLICMQNILLDFLFHQTVASREMCEQAQVNYIMRLSTA